MAALTIGRTSTLGVAPGTVSMTGDVLTINGTINAYPSGSPILASAAAARQQLLGYLEPGQEVVPISWTSDPSIAGYYRVVGVTVDPLGVTASGLMRFSITAQRLDAYASPQFESVATVLDLTNVHSLPGITNIGTYWLPYTALYEATNPTDVESGGTGVAPTSAGTRSVEGGTVAQGGSLNGGVVYTYRWFTPVAGYYEGAATVEMLGVDGVYRPAVGLDAPQATAWRISNGRLRVSVDMASAVISLQRWNGSAWTAAKTFALGGSGGAGPSSAPVMRIVRNRPEGVTVRVLLRITGSSASLALDLTLRRGETFVRGFYAGLQEAHYLSRTSTEAATAVTGGLRATVNDADGSRYIMASVEAQTNNLTIGRLAQTSTAGTTMNFMVGLLAGTTDTPSDEVDQFITSVSETHSVVVR